MTIEIEKRLPETYDKSVLGFAGQMGVLRAVVTEDFDKASSQMKMIGRIAENSNTRVVFDGVGSTAPNGLAALAIGARGNMLVVWLSSMRVLPADLKRFINDPSALKLYVGDETAMSAALGYLQTRYHGVEPAGFQDVASCGLLQNLDPSKISKITGVLDSAVLAENSLWNDDISSLGEEALWRLALRVFRSSVLANHLERWRADDESARRRQIEAATTDAGRGAEDARTEARPGPSLARQDPGRDGDGPQNTRRRRRRRVSERDPKASRERRACAKCNRDKVFFCDVCKALVPAGLVELHFDNLVHSFALLAANAGNSAV